MANKKKGVILFMAVGAISVLSILALGATSSVMQELRLARFATDANTSFYSAFSCLKAAKILFANDETPGIVTLYDLRPRQIPFGDKVANLTLYDEQSRINIDKATADLVIRLPGLEAQAELANKVASASFAAKEELLLLEGMTPEIYALIKDEVTINGSGSLNINTASTNTLRIILADDDLADKITRFRAGDDAEEGTEDDKVFSSASQIVPALEPFGLTPPQKLLLETLTGSGRLGTLSDIIALNISLVRAAQTLRVFKIIFSLSSGKVISWQEG